MAIEEACQVWIEQRIEEELENGADVGKSVRSIGREIAAEIEKIFKAKVSPDAIRMRYTRTVGGTNVPPELIELFLIRAKRLAKLAQKIKSEPSFESRKKELLSAANLVAIVLTETREGIKWV